MARVRIKGRFYIILLLLLMLVGLGIFLLLGGGREGELTASSMRLMLNPKVVLVRDESIVTVERYDKILFDVAEGAAVKKGDQIAQVFKWGYQEETMQSLLDVKKQILDYQLTQVKGIVNPELDNLTAQIQQKENTIRAVARGDSTGDILQLERELNQLLDARAALLKDSLQPDEKLSGLYQQEDQQQQNLNTWKRDILNNDADGVVSFYFDGYEQALSAKKLDLINADLLSTVLKGGGSGSNTDTGDAVLKPLYRLIDPTHFYIAFLTDASSPFRLAPGETYTVVFSGYSEQPYTGTAVSAALSDKQVVNMLEFKQPMNDLMGVRVVEATILKDATGLYVPLDAIEMKDGMPGIRKVTGRDTQWVGVEVLSADKKGAIIRSADSAQPLTAGIRYRKP